jgi:hypothetical protein
MRFGVNRLALSSELVLIYLALISSQRMIVLAKQGEQDTKKNSYPMKMECISSDAGIPIRTLMVFPGTFF